MTVKKFLTFSIISPRAFYFTEICKKSKSPVFIHYKNSLVPSATEMFDIVANCVKTRLLVFGLLHNDSTEHHVMLFADDLTLSPLQVAL